MKKLGLIGGTSWHSTIEYYRLINQLANDRIGTKSNPEIILYSIDIALMMSQDWERITSEFIAIAKKLEAAGAEALVFCANTTHKLVPVVGQEIDIPIIHIGDAIGQYAASHHMTKLGLLGTMPTMADGFIQEFLSQEFEIGCLIPEEPQKVRVHEIVVEELVQGHFKSDSKTELVTTMDDLVTAGAQAIILGCTELPILFDQTKYKVPLIDTTRLHAELCVDFALS